MALQKIEVFKSAGYLAEADCVDVHIYEYLISTSFKYERSQT